MYSFLPPSLQWIHFMKSTHQFAQRPLRGKYNFLERSISWVDLCTGPGGLDGVWVSLLNVLMWCVCGSRIHLKIQRKTVNTHPGIWWPYTEKIYLIWRCNLLTFFSIKNGISCIEACLRETPWYTYPENTQLPLLFDTSVVHLQT